MYPLPSYPLTSLILTHFTHFLHSGSGQRSNEGMKNIGYSHGATPKAGTEGRLVASYAAVFDNVVRVVAAEEDPYRGYHGR